MAGAMIQAGIPAALPDCFIDTYTTHTHDTFTPKGKEVSKKYYRLAEEGGTVTYTVSEFLSHTKNAVVKEFDLDGPGR